MFYIICNIQYIHNLIYNAAYMSYKTYHTRYIYIYTWHCICAWYEPIYNIYIYHVYFSFLCRLCTFAPLLNRIGINDKYKLIKTGGRWTIKSIQWGSTSCWVPNAGCWWEGGGPSSAGDVRHHIGCAQPWCAGDGARTQKFPQNGLPLVEWWAWKKQSWSGVRTCHNMSLGIRWEKYW